MRIHEKSDVTDFTFVIGKIMNNYCLKMMRRNVSFWIFHEII
jgi:hypothetical protein